MPALALATSIALSSFLGFDAITTLAEEANHPKRDIPRAIFLTIIIGGFTLFITGYIGMLAIPNWQHLSMNPSWAGSALFYVAKLTGGKWFSVFYTLGFLLAMAVFNIVSITAGSRLLFGMGRDGVLPKKIFAAINKKWKTPHWNIILIVALEILMGSIFKVDDIAELIDFGALLGFILLNISVVWLYFVKRRGAKYSFLYFLKYLFSPVAGILVLGWVFINMQTITIIVGSIWLLIGICVGLFQSKGYQYLPPGFKE